MSDTIDYLSADCIPWQEAQLPMLDERVYARWKRELGQRVIESHGRYWTLSAPGFYQPVHPLARLRHEEAVRPTTLCWGFRARLVEGEDIRPNASIPVHLLPAPQEYDITKLASKRRTEVRKALREADVVALRAPDLLLDQGYRIVAEQHARTPAIGLREPAEFRTWVRSYFEPQRGLVFAALRHGRLVAFAHNAAVDGVLYCQELFLTAEALRLGLSLALFHVLGMAASRSGNVVEIMNGLHIREREDLCVFKRRQGFELVMLPAYAWFAPGCEAALRRIQPHRAYRLTGRG